MAQIYTEIMIESDNIEKAWNILTDFESYPNWNPFVKELEVLSPTLEVGSKLKANLDGFRIKPKVTKFSLETKEFSWLGKLILPRIFDGEHSFKFEKVDDKNIKLIHQEKFRGILVWITLKFIRKKTEMGFKNMNQAIKEQIENS